MIKIRKAKKKDTSGIIKLLVELGRPKPKQNQLRKFSKLVYQHISDKDKTILVAEVDSSIVGMISIIFLPRLNQTKPEAWIPDFVVNKTHRNQGIGTALLEECLEEAKKKNCYRIRLESGLSRQKTHEFYKSLKIKPFALSFEQKT